MKYVVEHSGTMRIKKTYFYLSDFIRDELDDEDLVEFINETYSDTYALPPMLSEVVSLGKIMKEYLSGSNWTLLYEDMIETTIDALEEELDWADEDENGVKTIAWKGWSIQQYN